MADRQIELDIEVLQDKIDNKFEVYVSSIPTDLEQIKEDFDAAQDQNTIVQYSKYISQVEGRLRCVEMRNSSRSSAFETLTLHREAQLEAYKHLDAKFKSYGGLLE